MLGEWLSGIERKKFQEGNEAETGGACVYWSSYSLALQGWRWSREKSWVSRAKRNENTTEQSSNRRWENKKKNKQQQWFTTWRYFLSLFVSLTLTRSLARSLSLLFSSISLLSFFVQTLFDFEKIQWLFIYYIISQCVDSRLSNSSSNHQCLFRFLMLT